MLFFCLKILLPKVFLNCFYHVGSISSVVLSICSTDLVLVFVHCNISAKIAKKEDEEQLRLIEEEERRERERRLAKKRRLSQHWLNTCFFFFLLEFDEVPSNSLHHSLWCSLVSHCGLNLSLEGWEFEL